ncbi:MAG: hypothetical protein EZS28_031114, partial [Streblomastix strix]
RYKQFADTRRRSIIVRKKDINKPLYNAVNRSETQVCVLQGAALSRDSLIPFVIVKRPLRIQEYIIAETKNRTDATLVDSEGITMTGSLFSQWLHSNQVPFIEKQREKLGLNIRTLAQQSIKQVGY